MGSGDPRKPSWSLWEDLPPEEEDELIEKIAQTIVKRRLGLMAQMVLEGMGPLSRIGAELGMNIMGPYLEFFGVEKVTALFRNRENVKRLIDRIEELEEEHKSKKRTKAKG